MRHPHRCAVVLEALKDQGPSRVALRAILDRFCARRPRDLGALQKLGGWKSVRMVLRYAHVNVGELAHTIDRLPGGNLGEHENREAESA
jgi:hypothetical protein